MARMSASDRRAALVDATVRLIAREGLAATSTRAIAAEAGMPLSSLHYVFDSRDQLVALAVREISVDVSLNISIDDIDFATLASAVRSTLGQVLEMLNRDTDGLLAIHECLTHAARTPNLRALGKQRWDEDILMVRYFLELIGDRLRLRFSVPLQHLATMVLTITDGMTFSWIKTRDSATAWLAVDSVVALIEHLSRPLEKGEVPERELLDTASFDELFARRAPAGAGAGGWQADSTE